MLVLSRKKGERLLLVYKETRILIECVEIRGDKVRIGVEAEDDVRIYRAELLVEEIKTNREKLESKIIEAKNIDRAYEQNKKEACKHGGLGKNNSPGPSAIGESELPKKLEDESSGV
jgi:carbon storage regulator CsrA